MIQLKKIRGKGRQIFFIKKKKKCKLHTLSLTEIYFNPLTLLSFNQVIKFQIYSIQIFHLIL